MSFVRRKHNMVRRESEVFLPSAKHELESRPSQSIRRPKLGQACAQISPSRETRTKKVPRSFERSSLRASARPSRHPSLPGCGKTTQLSFRGRNLPEESAFSWLFEGSRFLAPLGMTINTAFSTTC